MKSRDVLRSLLRWKKKTLADCADMIGIGKKRLYQQNSAGTLRSDTMLQMVDAMGFDVAFRNRETGEVWLYKEPHGKLEGSSQYKRYNTASARPLAYDGEIELFSSGQDYFFADYKNGRVKAVPESVAKPFIDRYGAK